MNNTKILIFYNQFPIFLFVTIIFVPINFETDDFSAHFAVNAILDLDERNNVTESEV